MNIRILAKETGLGNQIQFIPHIYALQEAGHFVYSDCKTYFDLGVCGMGSIKTDWNIIPFGYDETKVLKARLTYSGKFAGFKYRIKGRHIGFGYDLAFEMNQDRSEVLQYDDLIYHFNATRNDFALVPHYWQTKARSSNMVVMAPSGKKEKMIPKPIWEVLIDKLEERGYKVKIVDHPVFGSGYYQDTPHVDDLARELYEATYFVGVDSGPMHLADLLGLKCVVVFGPTSVAKNRPINQHRIIQVCGGKCHNWSRYNCPNDFSCYDRPSLPDQIIQQLHELQHEDKYIQRVG